MRNWFPSLVIVSSVMLSACGGENTGADNSAGTALAADNYVNWTAVGADASETSFSPLTSINDKNASKLGLAWYMDLPGEGTLEAIPLAVNGVLYFTGSYANLYAVDGVTGNLLWKYDPQVWKLDPSRMVGLPVNRGAAYADGKIFFGAIDGRLIALDAKTGELIWSTETIQGTGHTLTGAPRVFKDMIIVGNGGADFGLRGYVTAYDLKTGEQRWRFYTVPGSPEENKGNLVMERAAASWDGEFWKTGTGGTVWNGITYDAELNQVYIGVGNGGPYDVNLRSPGTGDNLYLASIVALNADTGEYVWHYQANPRESWDYKNTANMIATTLTIDGEQRKVLMQAPTNGFFYVLDRITGKLISAEKTGKVNWASRIDLETGRPVENPNMRFEEGNEVTIFPGSLGGHNFQPMSFSPKTGLVYIPYMQLGSRYVRKNSRDGGFHLANLVLYSVAEEPEDGKGALLAWDPVAQELRWKFQHGELWNGGTMVTAGNLVFQGTADGIFAAYNAETGERLWSSNTDMGVLAAPMTYSVNGKQYVSILVGYGGSAAVMSDYLDVGWSYRQHKRRLLTFSLNGEASLPASPPRSFDVLALDDPALKLDEADILAGGNLYTPRCSYCHGLNLRASGGPAPDLRESAIAVTLDGMRSVLLDGSLMSKGMPSYDFLTEEQVQQIHAYIRAGAREALGLREASEKAGASGL